MFDRTDIELQYVRAHRNVLEAIGDCTKYVSSSLAQQVDALEALIGDEKRIEQLKRIAER